MESDEGLGVSIPQQLENAVRLTRRALRQRGFRILSEMPVPPSIGEGGRQHLFLSVWEQMILAGNLGGLDVGDHLACSVVVFEHGDEATVAVLDPTEGLEGWDRPEVATQARDALIGVLSDVAAEAPDS